MVPARGDNVRPLRRPFGDLLPSGRRWKANWPAHLEWVGQRRPCTILDISGCGAKIRLDTLPEECGQVRLIIDNMRPIEADVVWQRDGEAGLRFHQVQRWVTNLQSAAKAPVDARVNGPEGEPRKR